jgi:hypothetical protein
MSFSTSAIPSVAPTTSTFQGTTVPPAQTWSGYPT